MGFSYLDTRIYKYGNQVKVVYLKRYADPDLRIKDKIIKNDSDTKLLNNICRARSMIIAYGFCNRWDYMTTFTLNPKKYDRYNLSAWQKDFSQFIRDERKRTGYKIKYLLIPERHNDNAWHMHGLIYGYPWELLSDFVPGIHPIDLCNGDYRRHVGIENKFGFNSFGRIRSEEASVKYITKYINKSLVKTNLELGAHLYYVSQGLKKPELIHEGFSTVPVTKVDHQNEFYSVSWIQPSECENVIANLY